MPKDDVVALTGGYRKTPVLQIGPDIFCDTALIADVLEELHPGPSLIRARSRRRGRLLAQWADTMLFWTVIPYVMQPAGMQSLFGNVPPEHIQAFIADRKVFRGNAPRMSLIEAMGSLPLYLERIEAMLADGRPYLLGPLPSIADFSTYHPLWFVSRAGPLAAILDHHPMLRRWREKMKAIGHGPSSDMSGADAIAAARTGTHPPRTSLGCRDAVHRAGLATIPSS
jgi:glutathione S-transferase